MGELSGFTVFDVGVGMVTFDDGATGETIVTLSLTHPLPDLMNYGQV